MLLCDDFMINLNVRCAPLVEEQVLGLEELNFGVKMQVLPPRFFGRGQSSGEDCFMR